MMIKKFDKNLDDLIVNLKITKPTSVLNFIKEKQNDTGQNEQKSPRFSFDEANDVRISKKQQSPQFEDSVIIDNYDDFNCYSFYELKESQRKAKEEKVEEFSFCNHIEGNNNFISQNHDDSLSNFSSIVDKLKTEGDSLDLRESDFFYSFDKNQPAQTDRIKTNEQIVHFQHEKSQNSQRIHTEYFSDSMLKSNQKSYKNIAKKTFQHKFSKNKIQPIYAKLTIPVDKQNCYQNSNMSSKNSAISNLSSKKSTYSSAIKKPVNNSTQKISSKKSIPNTLNKQKIKELNDKIRKQNHITYQSELKQRVSQQTPQLNFKKANIQPHKFSSYKAKLFG